MILRKAQSSDVPKISALVREVVGEKYGHFISKLPPVSEPRAAWFGSWVAEQDGKIVGVGLAERDYIDDLWVLAGYRNKNIGAAILELLEKQILSDGYRIARLRVFSENTDARRFYASCGWEEVGAYPHELYDREVIDLQKAIR